MNGRDEELRLAKRLEELAHRAEARGGRTFSEFLDLAGQDVLSRLRVPYVLEGGWPGAERKIACFGAPEPWEDDTLPIRCLCIAPAAPKFAQSQTHRDYLGALMGLGIRREVLGDIVTQGDKAWLFCLESISGYIQEQLTQVNRTSVRVEPAEQLPDFAQKLPEISQVVVASLRLDALISGVYDLSRAESKALCEQGRVFVNSRQVESASYEPEAEDVISVRGLGRFIYAGVARETRKGRLRAEVRRF